MPLDQLSNLKPTRWVGYQVGWGTRYGESYWEETNLSQSYRYTGKPLDSESGLGLYYYGARYYDPEIGRFLAIDPAADKYPGWSPYVYTLDSPLKFVDPTGEAPGDPFSSQDAAAQDFGRTYNDDSIRRDREYFTGIYKSQHNGRQSFTYEKPTVGNTHSVVPVYRRDSRQYTAAAHTHGADNQGYDDNNFSGADKNYAAGAGLDIYVATPNGSLQKYNPNGQATTTVSTSMPSDPNDPTRQNQISPTSNTKDDPTRGTWDKIVDWFANLF